MTLTFALERHQDVIDELNGRLRSLAGAAQPMCFGADMSHWQGAIDFAKVRASGIDFVVIKATEGIGYVDPNFRTYRAQAHAAGLVVLMYHFVGSSSAKKVYDATAEADFFAATVGSLAVGEGIAEDYEPANPPANPGQWSRTFLDRVAALGASPWLYMNSSTEASVNWTAAGIPARYGLWLAKYDNDPDADPVVHWPGLTAEQYWDKATVPGVRGPVDVDVFYGNREQLLSYCKRDSPTPARTGGFLMALTDQQQQDIYNALIQGDGKGPGNNFAWLYDQLMPVLGDIKAQLHGGMPDGQNNFHWVVAQILTAIGQLDPGKPLTAADIAALIPADIASEVADELATRLAS